MARLKRRAPIVSGPACRLRSRYEIRRMGNEPKRLDRFVYSRARWMCPRIGQERQVRVAVVERRIESRGLGNAALFFRLATEAIGQRIAFRGAALVDDTLRRALIKLIAQTLQSGNGDWIGVPSADVELLAVLAGQVGIDQSEVIIEAFVDRRARGACGCARKESDTELGQQACGSLSHQSEDRVRVHGATSVRLQSTLGGICGQRRSAGSLAPWPFSSDVRNGLRQCRGEQCTMMPIIRAAVPAALHRDCPWLDPEPNPDVADRFSGRRRSRHSRRSRSASGQPAREDACVSRGGGKRRRRPWGARADRPDQPSQRAQSRGVGGSDGVARALAARAAWRALVRDAILVLNAGSSSLKFSVFGSGADLAPLIAGDLEELQGRARFRAKDATGAVVGEHAWPDGQPPGHEGAIAFLLDWLRSSADGGSLAAVGHRVVHGGSDYAAPVRVTAAVLARLE